jgi:hypothetical protein
MIKKIFVALSLLVLFGISLTYAGTGDGGYAGAFLRMSLSARALGMGGAFVGVADDGFASSFNPAGLIQIEKPTLSASYRFMSLDRKLSYVSYQQQVKGGAAIGAYWINSGVKDVETRDDRGEVTGELTNYENAITVNFAKKLIKEFSLGVNIKYSQYNLASLNAYTMGFDFGVLIYPKDKLRVGLAVDNLGMKYSWVSSKYWQEFDQTGTDTEDKFPVNFKLGGSYLLLKDKLLLSLQADKNSKQDARFHLGAEYRWLEYFAGRLGYNDGSLTFGLGIKHKVKSITLGFDYAFISSQVGTNPDHLVSMSFGF